MAVFVSPQPFISPALFPRINCVLTRLSLVLQCQCHFIAGSSGVCNSFFSPVYCSGIQQCTVEFKAGIKTGCPYYCKLCVLLLWPSGGTESYASNLMRKVSSMFLINSSSCFLPLKQLIRDSGVTMLKYIDKYLVLRFLLYSCF